MGLLDRVSGLFGRASEDELAAMFDPEGRAAGERGDGSEGPGPGAAEDAGDSGDSEDPATDTETGDAPDTDAPPTEPSAAPADDTDGEPAGPGGDEQHGRAGDGPRSAPERDEDGPDSAAEGSEERPQAAEAATLADDWPDHDLDLTPGSLGRLDALVDDRWRADRFRDADLGGEGIDDRVFTDLVRQLGCYYGEVLVRHLDGEWVDPDDGGPAVEIDAVDGAAREQVFHVAAASLREPARFADGFEKRAAEAGRDPDQFGADGADQQPGESDAGTGRGGDSPDGGSGGGDAVAELREAAAAFVADWLAYDLDYGVASLQRLDRLVAAEYADSGEDGTAPDGDTALARSPVPDVVRATAGYFGEVLRREAGGEWHDDSGPVVVVEGAEGGARVDPVAVAADVLRGKDSFAATYGTVRGRLSTGEPDAAAGPGDDVGEAGPVTADDEEADGEPADRTDPMIDRLAAEAVAGEPADSDGAEGSPAALAERLATAARALADDWPDYDLDGSVESLARLDALVAREYGAADRAAEDSGGSAARDAVGDPLSLPADASLSVAGDAPIQGLGGYLAEVLRRHHDAEWRDGDDGPVLAVRGPDGTVSFDPTTVALAALAGASSFVDAYAHVAARAGLEPPLGG